MYANFRGIEMFRGMSADVGGGPRKVKHDISETRKRWTQTADAPMDTRNVAAVPEGGR
jgi:hypothetical protein